MKSKYIKYPCVKNKRYEIYTNGDIYDHKLHKIITPYIDKKGYLSIGLYGERNGIKKSRAFSVHRLVATMFIENPENLPMVNHKDGDKQNPNVDNLEWCTSYYNNMHAISNGLRRSGEDSPLSKITNKTVEEVCELLELGWKNKDIANELNISYSTVQNIRNRTCWKSISSKFSFSTKKRIDINTVRTICEYLELGFKQKEISKILNIPKTTIRNIWNGSNWSDISCEYDFPFNHQINAEIAEAICKKLETGETAKNIANEFQIPVSKVYNIKYKASWTNISCKYHF